jgi:hypothetical protein
VDDGRCRLVLGDCLVEMAAIPDGSIDLILADLPYGTTACKWDVVIPFEPLWGHYKRMLKPRGAVVLTASQPFTSMLVMSNPKWFRYELIWEKSGATGFLNARHRPLKAHENIVVFSPAAAVPNPRATMTYHPQMWHGPDKGTGRPRRGHRPQGGQFTRHFKHGVRAGGTERFPRSVIRIPGVNDAKTDRAGHPTQKPVALMEYLIRTYSNEDDTVLDNAMGSGSTAIACLNTDRRFIGIEKDSAIFATARRRIDAELARTPLLTECGA